MLEGFTCQVYLSCIWGNVLQIQLSNSSQKWSLCKLAMPDLCRFVKRSMHGTRMMSTGEIHEVYGRELVILRNETRWTFLNTLFSVSEAVMYAQVFSRPLLCQIFTP